MTCACQEENGEMLTCGAHSAHVRKMVTQAHERLRAALWTLVEKWREQGAGSLSTWAQVGDECANELEAALSGVGET